MSVSRVTALAASLVCSVASTRWPVSEAWIAICAVSWSRISPIMMTSGSWRRMARRALAKSRSIFSLTWVCPMPCSSYSIGFSTVMMLLLPASSRDSAAYNVVVLPEPVGPGHQDDAVRLRDQLQEPLQRLARHADRLKAQLVLALVQQAQHGALAVRAGQRGHPHVDRARADAQRDAAVLRQALLGDVQVGHDLQARDQRRMQRTVRLDHFAQRAVDAEPHR